MKAWCACRRLKLVVPEYARLPLFCLVHLTTVTIRFFFTKRIVEKYLKKKKEQTVLLYIFVVWLTATPKKKNYR